MADHDGLDDGERQSGATGVATGGEERVEYLFPVRCHIGSPSVFTVILTVAISSVASSPTFLAL
jgi:hypothetical protein